MSHGGKRAGSGRPKGSKAAHTLEAELFRQRLVERVLKEQEPIIDALITKAKEGQIPALKEVFERVLGKVKDVAEIEDKRGYEKIEQLEQEIKKLLLA